MITFQMDIDSGELVGALNKWAAASERNDYKYLKAAGVWLRKHFVDNLNAGVDPKGNPLPKPAMWTRIAGKGRGASQDAVTRPPLINTGQMRASVGTVEVTSGHLVFGWSGEQLDKARRQQNGIPGRMKVRVKPIKGMYSGILSKKIKKQ